MSRNSSGTYSLPAGNPVVSGTSISSTVQNATLADIATEITNSLDRSGRGAMTGQLQLANGSGVAPSLSFSAEPASGLYRANTNDFRMQVNSSQIQQWTATGAAVTGNLSASGTLGVAGAATLGSTLGVTGAATIGGSLTLNGSLTANMTFSAPNPATTTGFINTITPKSICKAWAAIHLNGGFGATVLDGLNISGATIVSSSPVYVGGYLQLTFSSPMFGSNYVVSSCSNISVYSQLVIEGSKSSSSFQAGLYGITGTRADLIAGGYGGDVLITVFGAQ